MNMLGLTNFIPSLSIPRHRYGFTFSTFKPQKPRSLPLFASNNNKAKGENSQQQQQQVSSSNGGGGGEEEKRAVFGLNWSRLLEADPDNILALGLTGLLTWASVQVLWQLLFISFAIILAALKYSFIAALLIFILIALL